MPRLDITCPRPAPVLSAQVDAAIQRTVTEHPELFDFSRRRERASCSADNASASVGMTAGPMR